MKQCSNCGNRRAWFCEIEGHSDGYAERLCCKDG